MFTLGSCHGVLPFTSALDSPKGSNYVLLLVIHFSHVNVCNISHWKDKSHCPVIIVECSLKTIPLWLCLSALMTLSSLGLVYQTLCTLFVLLVSVILTRFPFMVFHVTNVVILVICFILQACIANGLLHMIFTSVFQ